MWVRVPPPAPERGHPFGCPLSGAAPVARKDPLRSNWPEGIPNPLLHRPMRDEAGSDLDCPGAPRQKNSASFRFRGLRKSRENCISAEFFFLSETELSRGSSVSAMENSSNMYSSGAPEKGKSCLDFPFSGADNHYGERQRVAEKGNHVVFDSASSCGTGINIRFISVSVPIPGIRSAKLYCQLSTA